MAIIVKRDCGLGKDFENYVKINSISFHIDIRQGIPFYLWDIDIVCYLDKTARIIEQLNNNNIDESTLDEEEKKKYDEIKIKNIKTVTSLKIELSAKDFKLKGVNSLDDLYQFFYAEIKNKHIPAFGIRQEEILDKTKDDLDFLSKIDNKKLFSLL
jgi:hypothetical protein